MSARERRQRKPCCSVRLTHTAGTELATRNASAARRLEEGLEETRTRHRLGVFAELGTSFKTTNLIERVMAHVEAKTPRVGRWRTSDQKQRRCAATRIHIEVNFRRVKSSTHLALLHAALRGKLFVNTTAA